MVIVQISDMHVSKPGRLFGGRLDTRETFRRAISRVLAMAPEPDLVLLSGDLAETGAAEEYDFIVGELSRLSCPVRAIPGNHDIREEMLRALPACVTPQRGGHLSFSDDGLPVRVIGLDTIVPNEVQGEICAERLSWLRETLEKGRGRPALIAMHHPPIKTGFTAMDNYGIRSGSEEFAEIIREHAADIRAIVSGHVHRMIAGSIARVPVLVCPASSLAFELDLTGKPRLSFLEEPRQFLVHTWIDDALVSHAAFIDDFPGPFALS